MKDIEYYLLFVLIIKYNFFLRYLKITVWWILFFNNSNLFFLLFSRPTGSELHVSTPIEEAKKKAHHIGGYQVAIPVLTGLETKFGISLPRFSFAKTSQ